MSRASSAGTTTGRAELRTDPADGPQGPRSDEIDDQRFLAVAVEQARLGRAEGGIPIGAALVVDGRLLATGRNRRVQLGSAIRHGETDCLEHAGRRPASTYARATNDLRAQLRAGRPRAPFFDRGPGYAQLSGGDAHNALDWL